MIKSPAICQHELHTEIKAYLQHINFAQNCYSAYKALYENVQNNDCVLNNAVGFFTITQYALSKCLLIELAKLFCGSNKERTISKLINIVQAQQDKFDKGKVLPICEKYKVKLEECDPIIAKLKARRDQDLTHNDPIFFFGDCNPAKINYISLNDCEELINLVYNLCRELLDCLPTFDTICLNYGADDLNRFIDSIKKSGCFDKQ